MMLHTTASTNATGLVALSSALGQKYLNETDIQFVPLVEEYKLNNAKKFAGPLSLIFFLFIMEMKYAKTYRKNTTDHFAYHKFYNDLLNDKSERNKKERFGALALTIVFRHLHLTYGRTSLEQLANRVKKDGFRAFMVYAYDGSLYHLQPSVIIELHNYRLKCSDKCVFFNAAKFAQYVKKYLASSATGLVVNYHVHFLGYKTLKSGPWIFAPIGAYNEKKDLMLLIDEWSGHGSVWVKTNVLFKAMSKQDYFSGYPGGLLHFFPLEKAPHDRTTPL